MNSNNFHAHFDLYTLEIVASCTVAIRFSLFLRLFSQTREISYPLKAVVFHGRLNNHVCTCTTPGTTGQGPSGSLSVALTYSICPRQSTLLGEHELWRRLEGLQ